jgi:hypothetical protein
MRQPPGLKGTCPQLSIAAAAAAAAAAVQSSGGHAAATAAAEAAAAEAEGGEAAAAAAKFQKESYDYLLSMQIWSLTYEKVQALQGDADTAAAEVARLEQADIRSMWIEDLENFLVEYEKWEEEATQAAALLVKQRKGAKGGGGGGKGKAGAKAGAKGKKANNPWSDEESDEGEDMDYEEFKVRGGVGGRGKWLFGPPAGTCSAPPPSGACRGRGREGEGASAPGGRS